MTTETETTQQDDELTFEKIGYSFRSGAVRFNDLCYILCDDPQLEGHNHTAFWEYDRENWQFFEATPYVAHSICVAEQPKHQAIAIGASGYVQVFGNQDNYSEQIAVADVELSQVRMVSNVGGYAYTCGMDRQVFKREAPGVWVAKHGSMPEQPSSAAVFGFEAIHGLTEDHIYAVGWNGEIWHFNGDNWVQCDSPTQVILTGVVCADDGTSYACGQNGTLLKTKDGEWEAVKNNVTLSNFWGLAWFGGALYVSSMDGIFVLRGGELEPVDFGDFEPSSFYSLTHADGLLWSVGPSEILSFDGIDWKKVY